MTLLELVNRVRMECGVSGPMLGSLSSGSLETQRIRGWIIDAWRKVQTSRSDWFFMRGEASFPLIANKQYYTPSEAGLSSFASWKLDSFRLAALPTFEDEQFLGFVPYEDFRNVYNYGSMRTTRSRPVSMTVAPNKSMGFGSIPDDVYYVTGEYYKAPVFLSADTDVPDMPERFHMLLAYMAMESYGAFEAAPEVYQRGKEMVSMLFPDLVEDQAPTPVFGQPLA